ncbi:MAG: NAD-dependent epimerase/dehydratase family protein, partial [Thermicanus sp.]|nr:NAD-dependent epimerase/dehydratase family protein [Thermicanus sp.]
MRIAVTGGTGFVGKALAKRFLEEGNQVVILTQKAKTPANQPNLSYVEWLTEGSQPEADLKDIDA